MMGKQGRGSFSSGKAGSSTGVKKKMVIKPFKVNSILRAGRRHTHTHTEREREAEGSADEHGGMGLATAT